MAMQKGKPLGLAAKGAKNEHLVRFVLDQKNILPSLQKSSVFLPCREHSGGVR